MNLKDSKTTSKELKKQLIIQLKKTSDGYEILNQDSRFKPIHNIQNVPLQEEYNNSNKILETQQKIEQKEKIHKQLNDRLMQQQNDFKKFVCDIQKNLPFYSRWFHFDQIQFIEQESLPEFFQDKPSKTPEIYLKIRNFMVVIYWKTPKIYLTATACRRYLNGDVSSILRVHAFLEHWGIINGSYNPSSINLNNVMKQNFSFPIFSQSQENDKKMNIMNFSNINLSQEIENELVKITNVQFPLCFSCDQKVYLNWFKLKNQAEKLQPENKEVIICQDCFIEEKIPIIYSSQDFTSVVIDERFLKEKKKKFFSIQNKIKLIEQLKLINGEFSKIQELRQHFQNYSDSELLIEILKLNLLNQSFLSVQNDTYNNELNYQQNIYEIFQNKLKEMDNLLCNNDYMKMEDQIKQLKQNQKKSKIISQNLKNYYENEIEDQLNLKEKFFTNFEKIIKMQKKNIQTSFN